MRTTFPWHFRPTATEYRALWDKAILSVDANVLLDLYRFHKSTRDELLARMAQFKQRIWLTHQAADEFLRNRPKVISNAQSTFKTALKALGELRTATAKTSQQLRSVRLLPADVATRAQTAITRELDKLDSEINTLKDEHPDYHATDPILEKIADLFDRAVGGPIPADVHDQRLVEAQRRCTDRIPPGYMDDTEKEGHRKYGDYLIWAELLDLAKSKNLPVLFVTSEKKEDWWEEYDGKRIGARPELIKEAHISSGQRVLIYRTEDFINKAADYAGEQVDSDVLREIKEVQRLPDRNAYDFKEDSLDLQRLHLDGKILQLKSHLRDHPDYHVGWTQLGFTLRERAGQEEIHGDNGAAFELLLESQTALERATEHKSPFSRAKAMYHLSKTLHRLARITRDPVYADDSLTNAHEAVFLDPENLKYASWLRRLQQ